MDPWRYSTEGISVALRVTPRGGRDDIDGIETLANGRAVVKVRVRAIAEGGEANRAVTELLAKVLGVPKARVKILQARPRASSRSPSTAIPEFSAKRCERRPPPSRKHDPEKWEPVFRKGSCVKPKTKD